jgi:nicotinamidase/pyrazinamidase
MEGNMTYLQRREVLTGLAGLAIGQALLGRARFSFAADKIKPNASSALIVVDVQNCFLPGGSLAVKDGDQVIPVINRIAKGFDNVVMTQDWHTPNHMSFASSYPDKKAFETIKVGYGDQVLWPDHCVQDTEGAQIAKDIKIPQANLIIRKGFRKDVDGYSAFMEADRKTHSGLASYFKERGIDAVFVTGLLRCLDGSRCTPCRPYDLCGGGCLSSDRREWVAGQGLGGYDGGWRQENPVERSRYLNSTCWSRLLNRTDE